LNKNESLAHGTPTMRLTMERMKDDATVNGDVGAVRLCAKKSVVSARSLVTKKEDGLEKPGLVEVSQTIKSLDELCPRRTKATKKEWISRYTSLGRVIRRNGSVEIQGLERDQSKYKSWKGSDEKTGLGMRERVDGDYTSELRRRRRYICSARVSTKLNMKSQRNEV
jgi:hypothetical protein